MYAMAHNGIVNTATFVANYLGRVARATVEGISVGGMITHVADHLGYEINLSEDSLVVGKTKVDMENLIH